jgi:DUF1365 family protein
VVSGHDRATLPKLPALVVGHVTHARHGSVSHAFRHGEYQWLVDLDALPQLPAYLRPFAEFRAADHLGDPKLSIKANVERFLALQRIDLDEGAQIVMLANARVLGYIFNPLSVFWCYGGTGRLACVLAEVHNTHGERHVYVLHPDADGWAEQDKQFYVSPFFDVSGDYRLRLSITAARVMTTVALRRGGSLAFSATFRGRPKPATAAALAVQIVRRPLMPHRVAALIRIHGVWLWLRGLPVRRRPTHVLQDGV